jgi:hypothetical protein
MRANRVHRIPHPTFVTIAKRPSSRARDGAMVDVIWCFGQLRHVGTTGKSPRVRVDEMSTVK